MYFRRTSPVAKRRQDPNQVLLNEALTGPCAPWVSAALAQAAHGDDVLRAAIDAAVLASALARRAVAFLEEESRLRATAERA